MTGWILTAGTVVFCCLTGLVRRLYRSRLAKIAKVKEAKRGTSTYEVFYRQHISLPALFSASQSDSPSLYGFSFSTPTRLQSILVFTYVLLNLIACAVEYDVFDDNFYWPGDKPHQYWRYITDRTGIMAFVNLPLMGQSDHHPSV